MAVWLPNGGSEQFPPVLNTEMWTFQPKIESYANCLRRKKISPLSVTPSFAVFTTNTSNHG